MRIRGHFKEKVCRLSVPCLSMALVDYTERAGLAAGASRGAQIRLVARSLCSTCPRSCRPSRSARRGRLSARGRSPRGQPAGSPPARRPPCWGFCQAGLQCCRARAYRVYIYTSPTRRRPSRRVLSTTRARGRHERGADAARAARTSRCLPPCCQSAAPRRSCAKPCHYIIGGII